MEPKYRDEIRAWIRISGSVTFLITTVWKMRITFCLNETIRENYLPNYHLNLPPSIFKFILLLQLDETLGAFLKPLLLVFSSFMLRFIHAGCCCSVWMYCYLLSIRAAVVGRWSHEGKKDFLQFRDWLIKTRLTLYDGHFPHETMHSSMEEKSSYQPLFKPSKQSFSAKKL